MVSITLEVLKRRGKKWCNSDIFAHANASKSEESIKCFTIVYWKPAFVFGPDGAHSQQAHWVWKQYTYCFQCYLRRGNADTIFA